MFLAVVVGIPSTTGVCDKSSGVDWSDDWPHEPMWVGFESHMFDTPVLSIACESVRGLLLQGQLWSDLVTPGETWK